MITFVTYVRILGPTGNRIYLFYIGLLLSLQLIIIIIANYYDYHTLTFKAFHLCEWDDPYVLIFKNILMRFGV